VNRGIGVSLKVETEKELSMTISPVSGVMPGKTRNDVPFTSASKDEKFMAKSENPAKRAMKQAAVPAVVLLSLSPSLLNAEVPKMARAEEMPEKIEMVNPNKNVKEPETFDMRQSRQTKLRDLNTPYEVRPEIRMYQRKFKTEDEKEYTMYYTTDRIEKSRDPNTNNVKSIYFVPKNYKPMNTMGPEYDDNNTPPWLEKFVLHDLGEDTFFGAIVREITCDSYGDNTTYWEYEIVLPEEIVDDLLGLTDGERGFVSKFLKMNMVVSKDRYPKPKKKVEW